MNKSTYIPLMALAAIVQPAFANDYNFVESSIGGPAQQMQSTMYQFIKMSEMMLEGKLSARNGAQSFLSLTENLEKNGKKLAKYAESHPKSVIKVCQQFGKGVFKQLILDEAKMLQALKEKNYFGDKHLRYICKEYEEAMQKYDFRSIFLR